MKHKLEFQSRAAGCAGRGEILVKVSPTLPVPESDRASVNNTLQTLLQHILHWRKQTQVSVKVFLLTSDSFVSIATNPQAVAVKEYLVNFSMRTSHCGPTSGSL